MTTKGLACYQARASQPDQLKTTGGKKEGRKERKKKRKKERKKGIKEERKKREREKERKKEGKKERKKEKEKELKKRERKRETERRRENEEKRRSYLDLGSCPIASSSSSLQIQMAPFLTNNLQPLSGHIIPSQPLLAGEKWEKRV